MAKWRIAAKKADFEAIGREHGIDPVIARIIRNRDRITPEEIREYLYGEITDLPSGDLLKGVPEAAALLAEKIRKKKKLRIIGDYDADGICASYILKRGLTLCGDTGADIVIPHRIKDGYGINRQLLLQAHEEGVDTILTCDNGIAAIEEFDYAVGLGLTCIITDHHEPVYEETEEGRSYRLPVADIIIDPKQPGCRGMETDDKALGDHGGCYGGTGGAAGAGRICHCLRCDGAVGGKQDSGEGSPSSDETLRKSGTKSPDEGV